MTLIYLGLACLHLGRQPGACTDTHRWLVGIALARWFQPPPPVLGLLAVTGVLETAGVFKGFDYRYYLERYTNRSD